MKNMARRQAPAGGFVLSVLTGPNAGASVSLGAGRYTLGGDDDNDVVLAGLDDRVIGLSMKGKFAVANPLVDGVEWSAQMSEGFQPLTTMGAPHQIRLPIRLRLAPDVLVQVSGDQAEAPAGPRVFIGIGLAALIAGSWLGATLFSQTPSPALARAPEPVMTAAELAPDAPAVEDQVQTAATAIRSSPRLDCIGDCIEAAEQELQQRLETAGLTNLTLVHENGVLRLGGTLLPEQFNTWRQIRTNFEAEFGQSLPIVTAINSESAPILSVSSVWLGENAEVRTKTGNVYRIGDKTRDGWTVQTIERGRVEFERDGQLVTVRF